MQCLYPLQVWLESTVPHKPKLPLLVPCGKCIACRINKKREWKERLLHEFQISDNGYFLTLTYNDSSLPYNSNGLPSVSKIDCQKFFKRLRKLYPNSNIRYFLSSEYGELDNRPHYHCLVFNLPQDVLQPCKTYIKGQPLFINGKGSKSMCNRKLNDIWKNGFVTIGYITPERCGYTSDYYVDKQSNPKGTESNFNLMSRKPGIGCVYCDSSADLLYTRGLSGLKTLRGSWTRMPRLYLAHLSSDEMRLARRQELYDKLEFDLRNGAVDYHKRLDDSFNLGSVRQSQIEQNLKFHHNKKL